MDFNEYQTLARRTQNKELSLAERTNHALLGMASELGEIHGLHQKVYQGHALNIADAVKELGDLMWFASEYADVLNVSMDEVAKTNIEKLRKRYPDGFDAEHSVHREEYGG